jgi:hypothetical protein
MNYLNSDQQSYRESLALIPLHEKCWCGWYRLGECPHCPTNKTCADKCLVCMGTGKRWVEGVWETCADCTGTGKVRI